MQDSKMRRISHPDVNEPPAGSFVNAIAVGDTIYLSGLVGPAPEGEEIGDAYTQSVRIFTKIAKLLEAAGSGLDDIVRFTVYLTDIKDRPGFAKARAEALGQHMATSTLIEISALVLPEYKVEVEATAVRGAGPLPPI